MSSVDKIYDVLARSGTPVSVTKHKHGDVTEIEIYVQNVNQAKVEMNTGGVKIDLPKGSVSFEKKVGGVEINAGGASIDLQGVEVYGVNIKGNEAVVHIKSKNS